VLGGNKKGSGLVHVGWRDSLLDFVTPTPPRSLISGEIK
jgi:hypothetical protein